MEHLKMTARMRIVVVGNGMVGQRFLEKLPAANSFDITVVGEEPRPAYDRVQLSAFFAGKTAEDLNLVPAGFFESCGIAARLGERATAIDRDAHILRSADLMRRLQRLRHLRAAHVGLDPLNTRLESRNRALVARLQALCHVLDLRAEACQGDPISPVQPIQDGKQRIPGG
ncbi:MAG: hypothetical protein KGO22_23295, partial [Gammaproteobacteria bacterium]|nr:hypothetical protein [Gammaproteobacteria bacterium]